MPLFEVIHMLQLADHRQHALWLGSHSASRALHMHLVVAIHMLHTANHRQHALWLGSRAAALKEMRPLHKDPPTFAAATLAKRSCTRSWWSLKELACHRSWLHTGLGTAPCSPGPRRPSQLTPTDVCPTFALATRDWAPAIHMLKAICPSASRRTWARRHASAQLPLHKAAPLTLAKVLLHAYTVGGGARGDRTLKPNSATADFSRLAGRG